MTLSGIPNTIPPKQMFCLRNLNSSAITPGTPWTFTGKLPDEAFRKDKKARDTWINTPETEWNVYSLIEGLNENRRLSLPRVADPEGNPPYRIHGFAGDFDAPIPDADVLKELESFPYKPQWIERTLSGNVRLIWLFETPMLVPSEKFLTYFLEKVLEFFPADKLLPAFDRGAWVNCTRYYTNSGVWHELEGATPIPTDRLRGWAVKIGAKFEWIKDSGAVQVPLEILRPALREKYGRFADWPGDFSLGEQGPSFWIDDSTSPKSAIVRETGMHSFAAHATQGFYSWGDLLGNAFVKDFQADSTGRAVEGIFHDGKQYWRKIVTGAWRAFDKHDTRDYLRCSRGVSKKCDKQGISDLDRALLHIQNHQNVAGAGPFVFRPAGLIEVNEVPVLNTNTRRVLTPADELTAWGPLGRFPFISAFLDAFFDPREQLAFFLSWLAYFYRSGYEQKPRDGQNVFIAGAPGVGKGFLNHAIIGKLVGGSAEAESFLLGTDGFSSDLFAAPHWYVDDAVFTTAASTLRRFTEAIKKIAANRNFRCNEKFKVATNILWQGRAVITCNRDEESIRAIPDLSASILDKLMLFRTADVAGVKFLVQEEMEELMRRELPYFARWLLAYKTPEQCIPRDVRWGVEAYHEKSLVTTAEQSSSTASFLEIMEDWKATWFAENKVEFWEGTAHQLHKELSGSNTFSVMKRFDGAGVGRQLSALKNKGHALECVDSDGSSRRWKIFRVDRTASEKYAAVSSE